MSDRTTEEELAEAVVTKKEGISLIWIIPLIALSLGVVLIYQHFSEKGEMITVVFKDASGIAPGKTKVRLREVDVGVVQSVNLTPELKDVVVTIEMHHSAKSYLSDKTQFWLEKPRFSLTEVSGLQTILSGVYIEVEPGTGGTISRNEFTALTEPPVVGVGERGRYISLQASSRGSLIRGSPVYFRGFEAGKVEDVSLSENDEIINVKLFIEEPFDTKIYTNTRFWNVSGFNFEAGAAGFKVRTQSLESILLGGLNFSLRPGDEPGDLPAEDFVFELFEDRETAMEESYDKFEVVMFFQESLRGLKVGAPVTIRGMPFGHVIDIEASFDMEKVKLNVPVTVEINPDRLHSINGTKNASENRIKEIFDKGLRAQLKRGSIITGQLYIDLDFHTDVERVELAEYEGKLVVPTIRTGIGSIGDRINTVTKNLESITEQFNDDVSPELTSTLVQIQDAARSVGQMADYLERHPESIISGKKKED